MEGFDRKLNKRSSLIASGIFGIGLLIHLGLLNSTVKGDSALSLFTYSDIK